MQNLIFFETEEHQTPHENGQAFLAEIQKLRTQWKIIHEFKPTEYLHGPEAISQKPPVSLVFGEEKSFGLGRGYIGIAFALVNGAWVYSIHGDDQSMRFVQIDQLPKIGEWTKIEISQKEENGRFFLSFTVGGNVVRREDVTDTKLMNPTNVKILFGQSDSQPGFIRKLVLLEK